MTEQLDCNGKAVLTVATNYLATKRLISDGSLQQRVVSLVEDVNFGSRECYFTSENLIEARQNPSSWKNVDDQLVDNIVSQITAPIEATKWEEIGGSLTLSLDGSWKSRSRAFLGLVVDLSLDKIVEAMPDGKKGAIPLLEKEARKKHFDLTKGTVISGHLFRVRERSGSGVIKCDVLEVWFDIDSNIMACTGYSLGLEMDPGIEKIQQQTVRDAVDEILPPWEED